MSGTIEDKISLFTKVVLERIELDFQQKQKKLVEYYESRKTTIIKDNEERKRTVVTRATKDAETKKQQIILKTRSAMHLAVLKKKQEFAEKIMDEVKQKTRAFIGTAEYVEFLKEAIKQVLSKFSDDQLVSFSFSRDDIENKREVILRTIKSFRNEAAYKIEAVDSLIGGVFVKSGDGRLEIDFTINTILEESNKLVGEVLSSWLNKEQEK
ncbi:MAG: H(+)-transporting ATPase [Actinobacteria bacterium RBG_13_35_12]|uniref:V-type ATP synthase subunit E n=1 Tax=Candidatus Sediminicultor quintus TaxID=1797291 RepID=A0A1F5AFX7_9BACT|nr:MAG: H(+)-transporting ATPase [Actinobacteria bacterium RBG_13_35_12]OGD17392.1 MAG: H(+)-transporting ATPase [Candidatus Atribacteria bacterium RBG_19FT_COMBO_35_14]OGD35662.1 MAG: H(+)-transporting ATPase [Candidatus Atribacteria bacterium RBG_16_35_8]